jgi:hypothetical protein
MKKYRYVSHNAVARYIKFGTMGDHKYIYKSSVTAIQRWQSVYLNILMLNYYTCIC